MAGESTTTTLNDIIYTSWIEEAYLDYAWDFWVMQQFARQFSLIGKPSATISLPRLDSSMTVGDRGASVATAYNATEAVDLTASALTTSAITASVSEYALMRVLTDDVDEDSINGFDLMNKIMVDAARIITSAKEDDLTALIVALSNSVGTTNTDLTIAVAIAAHVGIRRRGFHAIDGVVYVLDPEASDNLDAALRATNAATAVYAAAADKLLGVDNTVNNGMGNGHVMNFRGYGVWESAYTDTMNSGVDVASCCLTPSTEANNPHCTFAAISKRPFRAEPQRDASLRASELVFSERAGFGELNDGSGTLIVSDAP